jgi:hypothetical protein
VRVRVRLGLLLCRPVPRAVLALGALGLVVDMTHLRVRVRVRGQGLG